MGEQISYFVDWTDRDFFIWLSAFIEGEGCIHTAKSGSVEITIANTNRDIIESIGLRLGFGEINEVRFDRENWNTKYTWRTRKWADIRFLLVALMPYLTFKREKAVSALGHISRHSFQESERVELLDKITALRAEGLSHRVIADRIGRDRTTVSVILKQIKTQAAGLVRRRPQTHRVTKQKVSVATSTRRHGKLAVQGELI